MPKDLDPGKFYEVTPDRVAEVDAQDAPDLWLCRRVADYDVPIPQGGALDTCTRCGEPIVYNPARRVSAPRVCMQCAGIEPLPFK